MTTEYEHLSAEERGAIMATLVTHLGLQQELAPHLLSMAQQCFGWAIRRLQVKVPVSDWHSLRVHIKNACLCMAADGVFSCTARTAVRGKRRLQR